MQDKCAALNADRGGLVLDLMKDHRSVRRFTDERLPEGLVELLVDTGTQASTSSNMQAYSVIWVTDARLKARVAELCADQPQIHQSAAFLVFCADLHKLTLCCAAGAVDDSACDVAEATLVAVVDAALVMQNVALAAEAHGLGVCMIGAARNHPREIAEALGLPPRVFALAGMCLGVPADEGEPRPRLPLPATLHENAYRSDEELRALIDDYDRTLSTWYAERGMHPSDPRWSSVTAGRVPAFERRASLTEFLHASGLNRR